MSTLDTRPAGLDLLYRSGNAQSVALTWPTGSLVGRTFTATLDAASLGLVVVGDVMTITATDAQTVAAAKVAVFLLTETTAGASDVVLVGDWVHSDHPNAGSPLTLTVNEGAAEVTVDVSGQGEITAQAARSSLESLGAQVDQSTARTLEARWLQFIRDAGSGSPPSGWNYLGGDVTDATFFASSNDALWLFADGFDAGPGAVNASDLYTTTVLPQRNGLIREDNAGTFVGAAQHYVSGTSGLWIDADSQGGHAGRHWWPIAGIDDGGTYRVACWRVQDGLGPPHGTLQEVDIVTISAFLTYTSHTATGLGALTDNFWVSGMWRDTTHTFVYAMEFVPPFDARTSGGSEPNYVLGDPENHYSLTRLARVTNGSLLTVASWEYWNGSTWVSGATNATPLLDIDGNEIRGDAGIKKINNTHYLLVAHALLDSHLDVYKAAAPQGPWTAISRVPLPVQGHSVNGPNTFEVGQLCKILPTQVQAPPAEHSIAVISRNTIVPSVGYSAEEPFTSRNIRRYCPQFAVIPHH